MTNRKEIKIKESAAEDKNTTTEQNQQNEPQNEIDSKTKDETIDSLQQTIEILKNEVDDLKDKYLRKAAEFENFKRRTEQDFNHLRLYANEQLLKELLPVIDDFERSLKISKDRREFGPFYKGVELIYQKLIKTLQAIGVKQIESVGTSFNVDHHDALLQIPKSNVEPNTIVEEVEKGYLLNDRVLRHAKVIVAKSPDASEQTGTDTEAEELLRQSENSGDDKEENR